MIYYGILQGLQHDSRKRVMRGSSVVILQASQINLLYYMYMYTEFKIIITSFIGTNYSDNGNVDMLWNTYSWSLL